MTIQTTSDNEFSHLHSQISETCSNQSESAPFPHGALPPILRDFSQSLAAAAPVPLELATTTCLAALSAALGSGAIHHDGERPIRSNLYFLTVSPDGPARETCFRLAYDPLIQHQTLLEQAHAATGDPKLSLPALRHQNTRAWSRIANDPKLTVAEKDQLFVEKDLELAHLEAALKNPAPAPHVFLTHVKKGKLASHLTTHQVSSTALFTADATLPAQILTGRFPTTLALEEQTYRAAHAGSPISTADGTGQHLRTAPTPCLTLHWSLTPETLHQIAIRKKTAQSTLLPRFLFLNTHPFPDPASDLETPESEACSESGTGILPVDGESDIGVPPVPRGSGPARNAFHQSLPSTPPVNVGDYTPSFPISSAPHFTPENPVHAVHSVHSVHGVHPVHSVRPPTPISSEPHPTPKILFNPENPRNPVQNESAPSPQPAFSSEPHFSTATTAKLPPPDTLPTPYTPKYARRPLIPTSLKADWSALLDRLLQNRLAPTPIEYDITDPAHDLLRAYEQEVQATLDTSTTPSERTFSAHHPNLAFRLALLLHATAQASETPHPTLNSPISSEPHSPSAEHPVHGVHGVHPSTPISSEPHFTPAPAPNPQSEIPNPQSPISVEAAQAAIALTRFFAEQHRLLANYLIDAPDAATLDRLTHALRRRHGQMLVGQISDRHNISFQTISRLVAKYPDLLQLHETDKFSLGRRSRILMLLSRRNLNPATPTEEGHTETPPPKPQTPISSEPHFTSTSHSPKAPPTPENPTMPTQKPATSFVPHPISSEPHSHPPKSPMHGVHPVHPVHPVHAVHSVHPPAIRAQNAPTLE